MLRIILIALLGLYLITVGLWPGALAPVHLAAAGAAALIAAIPSPVLALGAAIAWLKHRPTPTA
jgi:hypothetical protein